MSIFDAVYYECPLVFATEHLGLELTGYQRNILKYIGSVCGFDSIEDMRVFETIETHPLGIGIGNVPAILSLWWMHSRLGSGLVMRGVGGAGGNPFFDDLEKILDCPARELPSFTLNRGMGRITKNRHCNVTHAPLDSSYERIMGFNHDSMLIIVDGITRDFDQKLWDVLMAISTSPNLLMVIIGDKPSIEYWSGKSFVPRETGGDV